MDRIWLWVYCNKIPIYPIFYLLKGDYRAGGLRGLGVKGSTDENYCPKCAIMHELGGEQQLGCNHLNRPTIYTLTLPADDVQAACADWRSQGGCFTDS